MPKTAERKMKHTVPPPPANAPPSLNLTLAELRDTTCKYPYGQFPPYAFCGNPVHKQMVYCHFHARACYQTAESYRHHRPLLKADAA